MKKIMNRLLLLLMLFTSSCLSAQWNPNPTESRFYNTKLSTFPCKENQYYRFGLVNDSGSFNLILNIIQLTKDIRLSYRLEEKDVSGNLFIPAEAIKSSQKVENDVINLKDTLLNKMAFWLSSKNMTELLLLKETTMDMGLGPENFYKKNTSTIKINYQGKDKIITVFNIENEGKNGKIRFAVLSDARNPLIVKMDEPFQLILKEVR